MNAKYVRVWTDWRRRFARLNDAEFGQLIRAALAYVDGESPAPEAAVGMAFDVIREDIDRELDIAADLRKKRSKAGKISAEKRKRKATLVNKTNTETETETEAEAEAEAETEAETEASFRREREGPGRPDEQMIHDPFRDYAKDAPQLLAAFDEYEAMRRDMGFPLTPRAKVLVVDRLIELCGWNQARQVEVLHQSLRNGWKDLYPKVWAEQEEKG